MDQQAPQEVSPPSQEPAPQPVPGPSKEVVQAREAEIEARRRAIVENARVKMRAEFRQSQGLPEPASNTDTMPAAVASSRPSEPSAAQAAPAGTAPAPNTGAIAQAITAELQKQFRDAEAMRADAARVQAEADRRIQEAEAKVAAWQTNPAAYLQDQGLSLDQWQARLLNGGEPTSEEKLKKELMGKVDPMVQELKAEVAQLRADAYSQQRNKAVQELTPLLAKEFPIVNKLLGPDQVLKHLEQLRDTTKSHVDPQKTLAELETRFLQQYQETLQDPAVASKVMPSVTKSPLAEVVAQSPQTLTNRVTSSVPSNSSRPLTERERFARGREEIRKLLAAGRL